ncbi:peptide chain release factor 3 [Egicoccus sp. AB-alg6-2]|uniref:peptide chain release factor 3 n=1 Tax=Egicoccus sp. AB-alg6-2 TaxID=3242692 RepID=UPI00359D51E2
MDPQREAARRRTFAIISHPDAGKTTLTEKFLLYSGAIQEAGAVKSRKVERSTASDWLELEQKRGISVSSAVMRFEHGGNVFNLLDTPGHRDFSEDTYRVLSGVDAAVMVIDAVNGVEPQTEKLYAVCRRRGTPIITFVNKMDRPAPDALEILDDIEAKLELDAHPVTWPVLPNGRFAGVVDRRDHRFHRFGDSAHGTRAGQESAEAWRDELDETGVAGEELALLDELGKDVDVDRFLAGESTPVFFGSALANFGVRLLLDAIAGLAPPPGPRATRDGGERAIDDAFSGFVFKVQANLDPRHRDRLAFVRVCSGTFERGTALTCARNGKRVVAKYAHQVFGRERETVDVAYPGDVIGLVNATDLRIGDTLYDGKKVEFPPPPTFTPEQFAVCSPGDRSKVKQFRRGLEQLDQEGVVQVLRHPDLGDQEPLLAAVGQLQFDVATWRLEHEFGAPVRLSPASYDAARATDEASVSKLRTLRDVSVYYRSDGVPMALFRSRWVAERVAVDHPELRLDQVVFS